MFSLELQPGFAVFRAPHMALRVGFVADGIVRITATDGKEFGNAPSRIVIADRSWTPFSIDEDESHYRLHTARLQVHVAKATGALSYYRADGTLLVSEPERGGKWLTPRQVTRNVFTTGPVDYTRNIGGVHAKPGPYETVFDRMAFEAQLDFVFSEDEALFGFGSHEEGYGNLRGRSRELYQQNMKAVVPYFVSTRGYGMLFDTAALMMFHDDALGSYLWADAVDELDFYLIAGDSFDEITRGYYQLTGPAPMLPKWAFGFMQSKERYVNAKELLGIVQEYRRRHIPLDTIVLDWKSWPNGTGWGQKTLDPERFPDPEGFAAELHSLGARLMVSIWPIMTGGCPDQREFIDNGWALGNQSTYNAYIPAARARYWEQANRGLFSKGVDAWWCDFTEPFESDWFGAVKPQPHARLELAVGELKLYFDPTEINAYSLLHSQGIYEGQRATSEVKRVLNLTRSSYAGQHRYGTITWNGDITGTWETLRRCIPEGVNFCATGEPYWTADAGGFFINYDPKYWFWRGEYPEGCRGLTAMEALEPDPADTGCRDLGFWELYTRWMQYAAFLPIFRSHGTDAAREVWRFGDEGSPFYDALVACMNLRYRLMPYIYSAAAAITFRGSAMMRAVALDFPQDIATHDLTDEYLFGPGFLVCPVTTPMYFESGSRPIVEAAKSRGVYLPAGADWFDFWSEEAHAGGRTIIAEAPLERMPLFVRAGSIVPMTDVMQFVDEAPDAPWEVRVYTGADGEFLLYEDAGDGYGYERGESATVAMEWKQEDQTLVLHARKGSFPDMERERDCNVVFFPRAGSEEHNVRYQGDEIRIRRGVK